MDDQAQPARGRPGLVIGLAAAVVVAVVVLVVVLVPGDDDAAGPGGTASTLPQRPGTDFEQVAFDYVVAVRSGDLAAAQRLACPGFRAQVRLAPLGLRSPGGATVDEIDDFEMAGASVVGTSDVLVRANVGVKLRDGDNALEWVVLVQPDGGAPRVCGLSVAEPTEIPPRP